MGHPTLYLIQYCIWYCSVQLLTMPLVLNAVKSHDLGAACRAGEIAAEIAEEEEEVQRRRKRREVAREERRLEAPPRLSKHRYAAGARVPVCDSVVRLRAEGGLPLLGWLRNG